MKTVTEEYSDIHDSMTRMNSELDALSRQQKQATIDLPQTIRSVLHDETTTLQNRWLVATASMLIVTVGLFLSFVSNEPASNYLKANGCWVGLILIVVGIVVVVLVSRRNKGT